MKIRWHGQSAYTLTGAEHTAAIDPFGDLGPLLGGRLRFDYPAVPEHDEEAGTSRGPNTIFVFTLGGVRVCHFGDFGQTALRPEQREAIGPVDLLFLPVGGGPTIGADQAAEITRTLDPRWVVPMHYRTPAIDFLETADAFLALHDTVAETGAEHRLEQDGERATGVLHMAPPDSRD